MRVKGCDEPVGAGVRKKVCMVGLFGVGKTCLVQRYLHSMFSVRYLSTVGVKIDSKDVDVDGRPVKIMLWDLEGQDAERPINASYLRGAHGLIYVLDGTRRETYEQLGALRDRAVEAAGEVPSVVALNKVDLLDQCQIGTADEDALTASGWRVIRTSAKTGEGVEPLFDWLARAP